LLYGCLLWEGSRTSLEAEAYAAYMLGNLAFHREEHERALDKFATARRIYSDLSQVGTLSQKELFRSSVDELEPFIRFSEHRLTLQGKLKGTSHAALDWTATTTGDGASNALLQSKIDVVLLEARKQKVASLATIAWKQKQIAVSTQEIGLALLRPDDITAKLEKVAASDEKKREQVFVELLGAYDTTLQLIKTEIAKLQQQSKSGVALVHSEIESLQNLEEYVRYIKLTRQAERFVAVFKQLRGTAQLGDLTHVLDMLVQCVGDILSIPGLSELEKLIYAKYTAYQALFKAVRAATVAQTYVEQRKFSEAITLFQHATLLLVDAEETLSVHPAATDLVLQEFIKDLGVELTGAQSRTTAQSFLHTSKQAESMRKNLEKLKLQDGGKPVRRKSLLERQDEFNGGTAKSNFDIVRLPPDFQAVPCKPILFDIAFNELEFPDISQRMKTDEEKAAEAAAAAADQSGGAGGGFFGWFGRK
jgi:signal recognition particle subunit SRP68